MLVVAACRSPMLAVRNPSLGHPLVVLLRAQKEMLLTAYLLSVNVEASLKTASFERLPPSLYTALLTLSLATLYITSRSLLLALRVQAGLMSAFPPALPSY